MDTSIKTVIKQICAEKGLTEESVIETINSALAAAYRKDFGEKNQNIQAQYDLDTGKTSIFDVKEVVVDLTPEELAAMEELKKQREEMKEKIASGEITADELRKMREERAAFHAEQEEAAAGDDEERHFNPRTEIQLSEAKQIKKDYKIGDIVKTELELKSDFGRMAAQTAKQVIIQKLREAERNVIYQEYKDKEGKILTGMVQKFEGRNIIIDLDRINAILPPQEQIRTERYKIGDRVKLYVMSVMLTTRGPEIIVSRAHPEIVKMLFTLEIPEIASGVIKIMGIAREAGSRTKISVHTDEQNIDPIGSCIGQRGARIQTIINELSGEKIDIIQYSDDAIKYLGNALLPAKITKVVLNDEEKSANVIVPQDQLSLTIGRAGQNVRLASRLTGWKISIKEAETGKEVAAEIPAESVEPKQEPVVDAASTELAVTEPTTDKPKKVRKPRAKKVKKNEEETDETQNLTPGVGSGQASELS
ncbi:MAG: transcription termination factor NusA [Patescibacteria group bacterium]